MQLTPVFLFEVPLSEARLLQQSPERLQDALLANALCAVDFTAVRMWLRNRCEYRIGIRAPRTEQPVRAGGAVNRRLTILWKLSSDGIIRLLPCRREYSERSILLSTPRIMFSFLRSPLPLTVSLESYTRVGYPGSRVTARLTTRTNGRIRVREIVNVALINRIIRFGSGLSKS